MRESVDFSPLLLWSIIWEEGKKKKKLYKFYIYYPATSTKAHINNFLKIMGVLIVMA